MADDGWTTVGGGRGGAAAGGGYGQPGYGGGYGGGGGDGGAAAAGMTNSFAALKVEKAGKVSMPKEDAKPKKDDKKKKKRDAKRMEKAMYLLDPNAKPGYLGNLTAAQQQALNEIRGLSAHLNAAGCLDGAPQGLTDPHLLRFLRARDFNVKKAMQMLEAAIAWRREYRPNRFQLQDIRLQLDRGTGWRHGHDKMGRPAIWSRSGLHDPAVGDVAVHATLYNMEECANIVRAPIEGYTIVFDLTGYANRNSDLSWCKTMIGFLQNYYPERMGACLILNAPFSFRMLWAAIKGLLTARTTDKIVFLTGREKLLMYFDRDQLPAFLGGGDNFDPKQWVASQLGPTTDPRAVVHPDWIAACSSGGGEEEFDEDED